MIIVLIVLAVIVGMVLEAATNALATASVALWRRIRGK
jgi:hypothetical protein